jgi:N-carbamoylputrescine amidase
MTELSVAALQMAMVGDIDVNIATAERLVREAAAQGARIILIPELFEGPYFCKDQLPENLDRARPLVGHPTIEQFAAIAKELDVVLPLSVYERAGQVLFNTVVIVDGDGTTLGYYRKSHIPDGPGYTEKYYFSPGDTGFKVWKTRHGTIGVGICWDQWFPESARSMALLGAEVLLYPTAIGSEPRDPDWDSSGHWQRVMQGHAGANLMPLVAANRIGHEIGITGDITFYGSSFIADGTGAMVAEAGRDEEAVIVANFDVERLRNQRAAWGLFRDRRPELYGPIVTFDGQSESSSR